MFINTLKQEIDKSSILQDPLEKNIILERYEFHRRCQRSEETFYTFLQNVQNLAESCEFHADERDFLIRDRFVCGLNDKDIISAIIANGGNPSIDEVLEICDGRKQIEASKDDNKSKTTDLVSGVELNCDIHKTFRCHEKNYLVHKNTESVDKTKETVGNTHKSKKFRNCSKKTLTTKTQEIELPCDVCNKPFRNLKNLKQHKKVHEVGDRHVCDVCGKEFLRKAYLIIHKRKIHPKADNKIKALECYICKQYYRSLLALKTHMYWHYLPKNYLCTQCGEQFRKFSLLQRHLMRADHNGVDTRKFQCMICNNKFYDKTQFMAHRVVHTKEKPYTCNYENCDKSYTTKNSLRAHARIHTGQNIHCCKMCDYKFTTSTNLKRHMLVHTGRPKKVEET